MLISDRKFKVATTAIIHFTNIHICFGMLECSSVLVFQLNFPTAINICLLSCRPLRPVTNSGLYTINEYSFLEIRSHLQQVIALQTERTKSAIWREEEKQWSLNKWSIHWEWFNGKFGDWTTFKWMSTKKFSCLFLFTNIPTWGEKKVNRSLKLNAPVWQWHKVVECCTYRGTEWTT